MSKVNDSPVAIALGEVLLTIVSKFPTFDPTQTTEKQLEWFERWGLMADKILDLLDNEISS